MGDPKGFLTVPRLLPERRPVSERLRDFEELERHLPVIDARAQASRCMDCGIPFCHQGCPLGNLIPDFNDLVYRDRWRDASRALHATNNFPEVTGRVCPAPCETSCVLALEGIPVTIEHLELEIADRAWAEGWVRPQTSSQRTGKRVAVVGSGPAGLACAQQLARAGHAVTVFERDAKIGGLLRYGIPDFKLEKHHLDRRVKQMQGEGVTFRTRVEVGRDVSVDELRGGHDAIVLAVGATRPRDLPIEGRDLEGVSFAMELLTAQNRAVGGERAESSLRAEGKRVVVLGGGDTGSDCVGTSLRQGALSVLSLELMPRPPESRSDETPWPEWPLVLRTSSSHEEGGERSWAVLTKRFVGEAGRLTGLEIVRLEWEKGEDGRARMREVPGTEEVIAADLCLLALGFVGPETPLLDALGLTRTARGAIAADEASFATSDPTVFACGDGRRGQSLVVWAIWEGREAARAVDLALRGETRLPSSPRNTT